METTTSVTVDTLNDLIEINNDRIKGYETAISELKDGDADLKVLFANYQTESTNLKTELEKAVSQFGGEAETGTTNRGKIYRAWMDVKAVFTGKDRTAILASCEYGEDAAQKAYKAALEESELDISARELIAKQQQTLKASHDKVKALRDASKN